MKVWLDDERPAPGAWIRGRTAAEAITLLQTGSVKEISLDHDLGDDAAGTGYDVLLWIERAVVERGFKPPAIFVHTANPPAKIRMLAAVEAIERRVEALTAVPDTSAQRLAALPPGYVETVVVKCREALGDALQEVILYGSRAYGRPTPRSDVDIALIVTENAWPEGKDEHELASAINSMSEFGLDTQIYVETREEIESYRDVGISMQSNILERGIRLYLSNRVPAPKTEVQPKTHHSIARQWLKIAERKIRTIENELSDIETERLTANAVDTEYLFYSACWSFKAVLFARGVSCAQRKLRWNLAPLQRLAALIEPELRDMSDALRTLPWHYDHFRYGFMTSVPYERSLKECQAALAAARLIYAKCVAAVERSGEKL